MSWLVWSWLQHYNTITHRHTHTHRDPGSAWKPLACGQNGSVGVHSLQTNVTEAYCAASGSSQRTTSKPRTQVPTRFWCTWWHCARKRGREIKRGKRMKRAANVLIDLVQKLAKSWVTCWRCRRSGRRAAGKKKEEKGKKYIFSFQPARDFFSLSVDNWLEKRRKLTWEDHFEHIRKSDR